MSHISAVHPEDCDCSACEAMRIWIFELDHEIDPETGEYVKILTID